jgi:hypothetical protein
MVSWYHHRVFCFFYLEQPALKAKQKQPQGQEFQETLYGTEEGGKLEVRSSKNQLET